MTRRRLILFAVTAGLAVFASGCSDSNPQETYIDTFDSYFASFSMTYDAAATISDLADRSSVVIEAALIDVQNGRIFGDSIDDPNANLSINLVFESDDGQRFYVGLPRPRDSAVDAIRSALPIDARSIIFLQPNNDPVGAQIFQARQDGNEWFFTTPQGWVLEDPERGVVQPINDQVPFTDAPDPAAPLSDWMP